MLKVENLNAGYGSVNILWDVSMELNDGEVVAVTDRVVLRRESK